MSLIELNNPSMLAIIKQFHSYGIQIPLDYSEGSIHSLLQISNISQLIEDHKWLTIQYRTYCAYLMKKLREKAESKTPALNSDFVYELENALLMAEILEYIHSRHMTDSDDTDEIALMRYHQSQYRRMLRDRGKTFELIESVGAASYSDIIHNRIGSANRLRLFTVRVRRLLINLAPLFSNFEAYGRWIQWAEEGTGPLFAYLAWITLFPRLLKNLFLLGKHLLPVEGWLTEEELSLDWKTRLIAQLERHWFELGNDLVTVTVNLTNCFILTGSANLYLGIALLTFDVVLASWRANYEIRRLTAIVATYEQIPDKIDGDLHYLELLNQRIAYEKLRHEVAVVTAVLILLGTTLTLPILAFNITIPLLGALITVLTTMGNMYANQYIEQYKPDDKVIYISNCTSVSPSPSPTSNLVKCGIFAPTAKDNVPEHTLLKDEPTPNSYSIESGYNTAVLDQFDERAYSEFTPLYPSC